MNNVCEGRCEEHTERVRRVWIAKKQNWGDWGYFYYCDNAIETDRANGFTIEIVEEKDDD